MRGAAETESGAGGSAALSRFSVAILQEAGLRLCYDGHKSSHSIMRAGEEQVHIALLRGIARDFLFGNPQISNRKSLFRPSKETLYLGEKVR